MSVAEGRLDAPEVYDFAEVEARWQGQWDKHLVPTPANTSAGAQNAYYVLQSPPYSGEYHPLAQLKRASFADALTRYHRLRGRNVLTDYAPRTFDDVQAGDLPERLNDFHSHIAGQAEGVELIFACGRIDKARLLTKTLTRADLMKVIKPYLRALPLGIVTGEDHLPITTTQPYIARYGADTVGCYLIFMGPHEHDLPWSEGQLRGVHRFLGRFWRLAGDLGDTAGPAAPPDSDSPTGADLDLLRRTHQTIVDVTGTMESDLRLHLVIAAIMGLVTTAIRVRGEVTSGTLRFATSTAARLLFPFAPHCCAEVYHRLTGEHVWKEPWPI